MKKNKPSRRHESRCRAMQALYQWSHTQQEPSEILAQFAAELDSHYVEMAYFNELVKGAIVEVSAIDELIKTNIGRALRDMNPVEHAILRISVYELLHCLDVPYRVVINEALEIAKTYGSDQGFRFINGVLDALAPKLRAAECNNSR